MKNSHKVVFVISGISITPRVCTNLKELHTALVTLEEALELESVGTYAELCKARRTADSNNQYFYESYNSQHYGEPGIEINEVYLNDKERF